MEALKWIASIAGAIVLISSIVGGAMLLAFVIAAGSAVFFLVGLVTFTAGIIRGLCKPRGR